MPSGMPINDDQELTLIDLLNIMWRRKFFILTLTILFVAGGAYYAFSRPAIYKAVCRVMPSGGGKSVAVSGGLGEFASMFGFTTGSSSGQTIMGVIRGESVIDAIIDRFNLMEKFNIELRTRARKMVLNTMQVEEEARSGGITSVSYSSVDPEFAAEMANALVEELQKKLQDIAIDDAQQRRNFFEAQLQQSEQELTEAEEAIINYQQSKGLVAFETQTQNLLSAMNSLRNQIAAKNVEISSMRSYASRDNPRLRLAQSQLEAMTKELRRLEEQQQSESTRRNTLTSGDLLSSIGQLPEMGIEYQHYVRTLRFATAKYETMLRQYESAKLSEVNDMSTIYIIDKATVPDEEDNPRRTRQVVIIGAGGFILSIVLAFFIAHIQALIEMREEEEF